MAGKRNISDPMLAGRREQELRRTYDDAVRKAYRKFKGWNGLAFAIESYMPRNFVPPTRHDLFLSRMCLERRLILAYACAIVDAMEGEVSLFDFFPYLTRYAAPLDPETKPKTRS